MPIDGSQDTEINRVLSLAINNGLDKLDVYHKKLRSTPAYVAALVLDPRLKWRYLEEQHVYNELRGELASSKNFVKKLWENEYMVADSSGPPATPAPSSASSTSFLASWIAKATAASAAPAPRRVAPR
jgi:hypothetical protein